MHTITRWRSTAPFVLILLIATEVVGQVSGPSFPSINTGFPPSASVAASPNRSPGLMVSAGVSRAQNAITLPRPAYNITEVLPPISRRALFLSAAIDSIFQQVDGLITFFNDLLLERAGLEDTSPTVPPTTETENPRNPGVRKKAS